DRCGATLQQEPIAVDHYVQKGVNHIRPPAKPAQIAPGLRELPIVTVEPARSPAASDTVEESRSARHAGGIELDARRFHDPVAAACSVEALRLLTQRKLRRSEKCRSIDNPDPSSSSLTGDGSGELRQDLEQSREARSLSRCPSRRSLID